MLSIFNIFLLKLRMCSLMWVIGIFLEFPKFYFRYLKLKLLDEEIFFLFTTQWAAHKSYSFLNFEKHEHVKADQLIFIFFIVFIKLKIFT